MGFLGSATAESENGSSEAGDVPVDRTRVAHAEFLVVTRRRAGSSCRRCTPTAHTARSRTDRDSGRGSGRRNRCSRRDPPDSRCHRKRPQYGLTWAGPMAPMSEVTSFRNELSMNTTLASSSGDRPWRVDASRIQPENSVAVARRMPSALCRRCAKRLTSSFQGDCAVTAAGIANGVRSTPRSPASSTTAVQVTDANASIAT